MSVHLDWQQDLEEEGWPRRVDYGPPNKGPRLGRYILIGLVVVLAAGGLVLWALNQRGLNAVRSDVQEAVTFVHWTLQQDDPELFINALDSASPRWIEQARAEQARLVAAARNAQPPTVEQVSVNGDIAEAVVSWLDSTTGQTYLARRWFRRDGNQWLWTAPRSPTADGIESEETQHLTLTFDRQDGPFVPPILAELDDLVADRCRQFGVDEQSCHFYVQWSVVDGEDQPLLWQDMPLPPLAETVGDEMDAPIYLVNGREADWRSAELRRRLQQFYQGRIYVAQSSLSVLRPAGQRQLPESLPGDAFHPLFMPTPTLEGVNTDGHAHPRWMDYSDRVLTDLVLRKTERYTLGSADYVNATWTLHQALLAITTGLPTPQQLALADNATPVSPVPVQMPELSGLGTALQTNPDETAVRQLAGLAQFLRDNWSEQQLARIPPLAGTSASLDLLLQDTLSVDSAEFTAGWREQERAIPDSPLSMMINQLAQQADDEAQAWSGNRERSSPALQLYTDAGRLWRRRTMSDADVISQLQYNDGWQVEIDDIGALDSNVWVEMTESDGQRTARDLRFYVWDEDEGWLRDRPLTAFWGNPRSASTDLAHWEYFEIDEGTVQAVMPLFDAAYRQVADDLGLTASPITIVVAADTAAPLEADPFPEDIVVASPRSYVLHSPDDSAADELRRDVFLSIVVNAWQTRANDLQAAQIPEDNPAWDLLVSAILAELERLDVPTDLLIADIEGPVQTALAQDSLPPLSQIIAQPVQPGAIEERAQLLVGMYIFERHGLQWLDMAQNSGLAVTLDALMQQEGLTLDDLETDWRAFLTGRGAL